MEDQALIDSHPSPVKAPKYIPDSLIIHYVNKDLPDDDIAQLLGCDRSNITKRRKHLGISRGSVKAFKENRADVLAVHQCRILDNITMEDIKDASLQQKATAMGILYDKERLERGQSTSNIAYQDVCRSLEEIEAEIRAIQGDVSPDTEE